MTNTLTTECTHCNTRFRLLPAQLEVAQGMVRCGSCRKVFNAIELLNIGTKKDRIDDDFLIHDDLEVNLDTPEFEQELARLAQQEHQAQPSHPDNQILSNQQHSAEYQQPFTQIVEAPFDEEAWAAQLLAEEGLLDATSRTDSVNSAPSAPTSNSEHDAHTPESSTRQGPHLREAFSDLDVGPLELSWKPKPNPWKKRLLWGLLSTLTLGLLIAQYTYVHFDELARHEHTRLWLQRICPLVGCSVPKHVNVGHMKSSNLMVRKHPEFKGALLIDAVIYNRASYVQAYPLIKLNFLGADNQVLASRSFTPAEYLGGELAGSEHMPAQTPIRISFEVLLPTQMAQHYSIEFLSPY